MTDPIGSEQPAMDLYQVLGVEPRASGAQITRSYRQLARRYHPDVTTTVDAAERFAQVTHAYRVLSDPRARARYDASRAARSAATPNRPTGSHPGRSSPTRRARPDITPRETFWLGRPAFADAFHLGTDLPTRPPADDQEAELDLSLEEAYHGTCRTVTLTSHERTEIVQVVIPPGVVTGQRIPVPTTHLPGGRNPPPVVLRVQLLPPPGYEVDGRDLHVKLPLSPWEAALGATVPVNSPAAPASIDVPPGTSPDAVLTLAGQGIPNPAGPPGNLYAHPYIVIPSHLTPAERDLFRRLAATSTFNPRDNDSDPEMIRQE